ncbi:MAG: ATP-binding cassette domain-containing protein [Verrucomicrobiaceae bacterium]|nr:ATP-binding cassette domain-containing protein [Verrucomicrobiaceae bacterium]
MLELKEVSYSAEKDGEAFDILHESSFAVPKGHFMAIVGPSGCGKTTLLKVIAGILEESAGCLYWENRDLADDAELDPAEVGYVPQFSVAYEHLTVEESVESAVELRVTTVNRSHVEQIADIVIDQTGLEGISDRRVKVLSGGQKRRLGLAMELVSNPRLLLCDEVTSGLDPRSENEIVHLLHSLSEIDNRIVINVTHSLSNLELYDSILVLHEGCVVYHGKPDAADHYFSVESTEDIYPTLAQRDARDWHASWQKHKNSYYESLDFTEPASRDKAIGEDPAPTETQSLEDSLQEADDRLPGPWRQFAVLLRRRFTILRRDRGHLFLQAALLFGFPLLVILFTPGLFESNQGMGIPPMPNQLTPTEIINSSNMANEMTKAQDIAGQQFRLGVLISGLAMFQVILLALMGSNNSAREIVAERPIYEKEKLAGLSPLSYLMSKVTYLALVCLAQSAWMAGFVNHFTVMPGSLTQQFILLFLVTASMTAICLAISSLSRSTEQASLLSVYLVGFQLPLSNAVLALPDVVATVTQPFIAAYWGWAGQLDHIMKETAYDVGIEKAIPTGLSPFEICVAMLSAHVAIGLFVTYVGAHRHRWE